MKAKITRAYKTSNVHEISVDFDGSYYLVIFGKHINGYFIAIPNWGKSCEATDPTNTFYNYEKLHEYFDKKVAQAIADAISEYWSKLQEAKENNEES